MDYIKGSNSEQEACKALDEQIGAFFPESMNTENWDWDMDESAQNEMMKTMAMFGEDGGER